MRDKNVEKPSGAQLERVSQGGRFMTPAGDQPASQGNVPTPLAKTITRAGMVYREFWRSGEVAIYCAEGCGARIECEVIQVQILPAGEFNGRQYPLRESFPSNSSWGEVGWTFTNNSHRDPLAAGLAKAEHIASRNRVEDAERKANQRFGTIRAARKKGK
jgi:hypothetical protein